MKDFIWLLDKAIEQLLLKLTLLKMSGTEETGYILEVDLDYPEHLHESHNSFPLAPEHLNINEDMLSPYAKGERRTKLFC